MLIDLVDGGAMFMCLVFLRTIKAFIHYKNIYYNELDNINQISR